MGAGEEAEVGAAAAAAGATWVVLGREFPQPLWNCSAAGHSFHLERTEAFSQAYVHEFVLCKHRHIKSR